MNAAGAAGVLAVLGVIVVLAARRMPRGGTAVKVLLASAGAGVLAGDGLTQLLVTVRAVPPGNLGAVAAFALAGAAAAAAAGLVLLSRSGAIW